MARIRSTAYALVLYPDDDKHVNTLSILSKNGYQYVAIKHDKDHIDDDPEKPFKKVHIHVVVVFTRQKDLKPLANELELDDNYIEPVRNKEGAIRYLTHIDHPAKAQYDPELAFGPLKTQVLAYTASCTTEEEEVLTILELLDTMPTPCSYRRLLTECCNAKLYATLRRMGSGVMRLLDEHNVLAETKERMAHGEPARSTSEFRVFCEGIREGVNLTKGG